MFAKEVAASTSIGIAAFMNPPFLKIAIADDFDYRLPSKGPLKIKFTNCARVKLQSSGTVQESRFARPAAPPVVSDWQVCNTSSHTRATTLVSHPARLSTPLPSERLSLTHVP